MNEPFLLDINALELTNPDSIQPVYSNNANLAIAPWDIRIIFSEIVTTSKPGEAFNVLRAHIVMNPAHAKALVDALAKTIEAYEKQFGEIKIPNFPPQILPAARKS
ncbi:MAG: DUF3467 domain-containing protein [Terracidiphilus sp.]|nr:DUF3467 domain-containing protein [Terracidiphilus sp.]